MRSAKGWITWYFRVRESHGAPGMNFVDSTGRLYADRCGKCRATHRQCRNDRVWVCGSCGRDWDYADRHIFKGEIQKSVRFDGFELKNARQFDIGFQLDKFLKGHEVEGHLYVANAMGFPIRELCEKGPERWPTWGISWSFRSVRDRVNEGSAIWEDMLLKAGIPTGRFE